MLSKTKIKFVVGFLEFRVNVMIVLIGKKVSIILFLF